MDGSFWCLVFTVDMDFYFLLSSLSLVNSEGLSRHLLIYFGLKYFGFGRSHSIEVSYSDVFEKPGIFSLVNDRVPTIFPERGHFTETESNSSDSEACSRKRVQKKRIRRLRPVTAARSEENMNHAKLSLLQLYRSLQLTVLMETP